MMNKKMKQTKPSKQPIPEIDYDKLAEAIVKAECEAKKQEQADI